MKPSVTGAGGNVRAHVRLLVLIFFALGLGLAGCGRRSPPNILFVLIDTLRPDRVGAHGSARGLTPFIDSLAAHGYVFRNAYAQTSWTNPSVATIFTSRYQSQHHITSFNAVLSPDEVTLAEVLQASGYTTGAFLANFLLQPKLGFSQGFDQYQPFARTQTDWRGKEVLLKERAERVDREALNWLDGVLLTRKPVFLYVHYMEPHNPYDPPDALVDQVLAGRPRPNRDAINDRMTLPNIGTFDDDQVQAVQDFYDAEVLSLDVQLRELFAGLQQRGFLENAIVVITADHGEEFREHGLMGHHQTLYEEVLRVPLILLVPGHEQRTDIQPIVSLIDLAPTLLELAGIPAPPSFEGHSLKPLLGTRHWWNFFGGADDSQSSTTTRTGLTFSELIKDGTSRQRPHERAVVAGDQKLIADVNGDREFYDLRADPGETKPDGLRDLAARAQLAGELGQLYRYTAAAPSNEPVKALDADTKERMRALGYGE